MSPSWQEALARPGEHVTALRELFGRLLAQETVFRPIVEELSDVDIAYDMGVESGQPHPLLGRWAPDLSLQCGGARTSVAELMSSGKGALIDLGEGSTLHDLVSGWADRVNFTGRAAISAPRISRRCWCGQMAISHGSKDPEAKRAQPRRL